MENYEQKRLCPRLKCEDCAVKDGDVAEGAYPQLKPCEFYKEHPEGYASGHIERCGFMHKVADVGKCPREFQFCTECELSDNGKTCKAYYRLTKTAGDKKYGTKGVRNQ